MINTEGPQKPDAAATAIVREYNECLMDMVRFTGGKFRKALKASGRTAIDPTSATYIEHAVSTLPRAEMVHAAMCDALADARVCALQ